MRGLYNARMPELHIVQKIAIWVLPVLFAVTLHEVAHGWVANMLGDPTARMLGRLTINPIKHIDPIGTILVPAIILFATGGAFMFGWAKPVPITPQNFKRPKRDMAIVGAAGPLANLVMGIIWCVVVRIGAPIYESAPAIGFPIVLMGIAGIYINTMLMVLNLVPIPPLDGGRVVSGILPREMARSYDKIERFGFIIVTLLLVTRILSVIIAIPASIVISMLALGAGINIDSFYSLLSALL